MGQPQVLASQGTNKGVTRAPTLVPELNRPVASARSFLGNHSPTDLIEAGKFPASASPRPNRAAQNPPTDRANPCAAAAMLQRITASEKPGLTPMRSMKPPTASSPIA